LHLAADVGNAVDITLDLLAEAQHHLNAVGLGVPFHRGLHVLVERDDLIVALLAVMIVFCTIGGYGLMNAWQPLVSSTQAGLIYCAEPLLASFYAFFLPGWVSVWAGIDYPNERLGIALLWGGALITLANVLINFQPSPKTQKLEVT
jgi:drug/metabolite transporter (DMT)-like permease